MADRTKRHLANFKEILLSPAWVCFIWFGMTAGNAFIATPARFRAPMIARSDAMELGAYVFTLLNKVEFIALIFLLIVVRASGRARHWWPVAGILALILVAQSAWLIPELTARGQMVAQGMTPPPSIAHAAYSTLELTKLALLLGGGFYALREGTRT